MCTRAFSFPVIHPYSGTSRASCGGLLKPGGGRFWQISNPISTGGQIMLTTSLLAPLPPLDFQTFLWPCEGYCCCHGLIMQNHGPWCKEEEKGSLVKNQSEFMHLWPWMEILTTRGAKRDENYTLPCYYVRERSIHKSIFIWFWFIDHTYVIHNTINNCQHIFVKISFFFGSWKSWY